MGGYPLWSFIERMRLLAAMRHAGTQKISGVAALRIGSTSCTKSTNVPYSLSSPDAFPCLKFRIRVPSPAKSDVERPQMTPIPAKVLAVDKQGDQYNVIVRIGLAKYRGSFNTLAFGENKPFTGLCHNGQLDLFYYRDPGLKTGKSFPLWTVL
jgi:hypothetical protein